LHLGNDQSEEFKSIILKDLEYYLHKDSGFDEAVAESIESLLTTKSNSREKMEKHFPLLQEALTDVLKEQYLIK